MKERVIYDPGEPMPVRKYASEVLAALDRARLEAADIPAFLQHNRYGEVDLGAVLLVVRREHVGTALTLLEETAPADDASSGAPPSEEVEADGDPKQFG